MSEFQISRAHKYLATGKTLESTQALELTFFVRKHCIKFVRRSGILAQNHPCGSLSA